jgi:hypothetical protein
VIIHCISPFDGFLQPASHNYTRGYRLWCWTSVRTEVEWTVFKGSRFHPFTNLKEQYRGQALLFVGYLTSVRKVRINWLISWAVLSLSIEKLKKPFNSSARQFQGNRKGPQIGIDGLASVKGKLEILVYLKPS